MKKLIIGLVGLAQSGKSTASKVLCQDRGFHEYSFAAKLKDICKEMFNLDPTQVETTEGKQTVDPRYGVTPRTILQHIGTEGFRQIHPTIWRDYVLRQIKFSSNSSFVISDVRFQDEAEGIWANDGIIVKIVRDDYQELHGKEALHPSEQYSQLPDGAFDYAIHANTGELEHIRRAILAIADNEIDRRLLGYDC